MKNSFAKLWSLALAAALAVPLGAAAEPTIIAPREPVPIGGFCDVTISGLADKDKLAWVTVPEIPVRVYAVWGSGDPILSVPTNKSGSWTLVLGFVDEAGKPILHKVPLVIGTGPPPVVVPPVDPTVPVPVDPVPTTKVTAVTFVYEKDDHAVPAPVLVALNKLNRDRQIIANLLEADTTDGTGQVPEQYKAALAEAKRIGLPCLIVTGPGGAVIRTVKDPKTEQDVLNAVPVEAKR